MGDERTGLTWVQWVWILAGSSFVAGMIASLAGGWFQRVLLLLQLVGLLVLAYRIHNLAEADRPMAGRGYLQGLGTPLKVLHASITALYNIGIMVVVFAVLVRTRIVDADIGDALASGVSFFTGLFVLLLGVAAIARIQLHGGIIRSWAAQVHGWFVAAVGALVTLAAVWLVIDPTITAGGNLILRSQDMAVLVMVAALGVCTQLFLVAGLPTTLELVQNAARAIRGQQEPQRLDRAKETPPVVYAGVLALSAALAVTFLLSFFDVFGALGGLADDRVIYVVAAVPLGLVFFFAFSAYTIWREGRRGLYSKKITTKLRNDILVYGISGLLGFMGFFFLVWNISGGLNSLFGMPAGRTLSKDLTFFTIMATTGPIGYYLHKQNRRIDNIENRLPDFLNDLAEQRRAGLTLAAALKASSKVDYGELSPEIEKMAAQVGWGVAFNDALRQFADRLNTTLVQRSVSLVIEASRTGGSVAEILKAAARDAYEIKTLEAERRVTMMTFVIVIYVVFFVFLSVLASLDTQFLPPLLESQTAAAESDLQGGFGETKITQEEIDFIYFNAAMIQALGNGIVGGVLSEGRVTAGFRHAALMALSGWVIFRLLVPAAL